MQEIQLVVKTKTTSLTEGGVRELLKDLARSDTAVIKADDVPLYLAVEVTGVPTGSPGCAYGFDVVGALVESRAADGFGGHVKNYTIKPL